MELEEAIKNLNIQLEQLKRANECGLATRGEFKEDIQAIETVLQTLEDTQKENSNLKSYLHKEGLISDYIKFVRRENK